MTMSKAKLIRDLKKKTIALAEKESLDLWEAGYLQCYVDLITELEADNHVGN
jgi:hypothetical protein